MVESEPAAVSGTVGTQPVHVGTLPEHVVRPETVTAAIDGFTALDRAADRVGLTALAHRLGREQPALLQQAGKIQREHGEALGQAAVFYAALAWSMFEKHAGRTLPRLLGRNLTDARKVVDDELKGVAGLQDRPAHERVAPSLATRQPHVMSKLQELMAEDVKESAIPADGANVVFPLAQAVVEAFDAALDGRRPGQNMRPVVREAPKVGRNDPCPCGSGKKFKRCCGTES